MSQLLFPCMWKKFVLESMALWLTEWIDTQPNISTEIVNAAFDNAKLNEKRTVSPASSLLWTSHVRVFIGLSALFIVYFWIQKL
jgi:hypothetical protein